MRTGVIHLFLEVAVIGAATVAIAVAVSLLAFQPGLVFVLGAVAYLAVRALLRLTKRREDQGGPPDSGTTSSRCRNLSVPEFR